MGQTSPAVTALLISPLLTLCLQISHYSPEQGQTIAQEVSRDRKRSARTGSEIVSPGEEE